MFECLRIAILVKCIHVAWVTKTVVVWAVVLEAQGNFRFLLFSRKLDRVAPNKLTGLGCINYPIMSKLKKRILHGQVKKKLFYRQIVLSFRRDFAPVTRQFFVPSLYILYAADFNYLIWWVIVTYLLLDISIVNSHATSAYECELLAITWHH